MNSSVIGIVLAAGKGTRMKSDIPKVLHEVFFAPMAHHVLDALQHLSLSKTIVVTGHQNQRVEAALAEHAPLFVFQEKQLGTGHAVLACKEALARHNGTVLILCGDTPLVRPETLRLFLQRHQQEGAQLTVMTTVVPDPTNYGRIISDVHGRIVGIVEEKDADQKQKNICEVNAGIYCVESELLRDALQRLGTDNKQGELYLTDIVGIATADGAKVQKYVCADSDEVLGVNSRRELAEAHRVLQYRYLQGLMDSGVTIIQPENVSIASSVAIGRDSVIHPFVSISGNTRIGTGVTIESFVTIHDSTVGDRVNVSAYCHLRNVSIGSHLTLQAHTIET